MKTKNKACKPNTLVRVYEYYSNMTFVSDSNVGIVVSKESNDYYRVFLKSKVRYTHLSEFDIL